MKKPHDSRPEFEIRRESTLRTNAFYNGLPVYRNSGKPLGPNDKTKWQRAWLDGFFTASALYRIKGLKPRQNAEFRAFIVNERGRLTGLYHYLDSIPVKRHAEQSNKRRLTRIARPRKNVSRNQPSQDNEALLTIIREVGKYLEEQDRSNRNQNKGGK